MSQFIPRIQSSERNKDDTMQATDTFSSLISQRQQLAANQEFVVDAGQTHTASQADRSTGWDPHEVWQRMIQQPRQRRLQETT